MKRREFTVFAAATLAIACAGVASKARKKHERSRACTT